MTRRVLAALIAVTSLAVLAFYVPAAIAIERAHERGELLELQREASILASQLTTVDPTDDAAAMQLLAASEHRFGLYSIDGTRLAGVGPTGADEFVREAIAGDFAEGTVGGDLVAAEPVRIAGIGTAFVIRIEAPRSASRDQVRRSLLLLGAAGLSVIGLAAGVGVWLARRLNRPVEQLTVWAATGGRSTTVPEATGITELDALRSALLDDRARIDDLLQRERSFSSQVSHQLRTPVAAMRVAIETERTAPRENPTIVLDETLGQLDRLESTINSLLALARHAERRPVEADLLDLVRSRSSEWRPRAEQLDRQLTVEGASVVRSMDVDAVGHIVDVLIENALAHGAGAVRVRSGEEGELAFIEVADEGRSPTTVDAFADTGAESSHGIGLRLARSLAESSGGRLVLLPTPTTIFRLEVGPTFTSR